jgi:hypothetical protein
MKIKPVLFLITLLAALPSVPAHAQTDTPKAERVVWPPPGSTLTMNFKLSGSLGSGMREVTAQWLGEVDWTGNASWASNVRDRKLMVTFQPYETIYDWALFVGKSWLTEFQEIHHDRNQTLEEKLVYTVEAFEEITIPAGTFKTFRIRFVTPQQRYVVWYEPKLGMEIKRGHERYAAHPFGVGTHQMEAISYAVKK